MGQLLEQQIRVYGIVQGVGFRPTVDRHAHTAQVTGSVSNKGPYVEIFAEGTSGQLEKFRQLLKEAPPARSVVIKMEVEDLGMVDEVHRRFSDFSIITSEKTKGEIFVSPDIAVCEECKKELYDPDNRRYLHPFINCTCCGPRLTILDALPYDRERTSMKEFPMCPACREEYENPASRRYDAQPVCCNDCGPTVYILGEEGVRGREAITKARKVLAEGGIVAVKGIGGFHLACNAADDAAVARLREKKHRPAKPFAVMFRDEEVAARECEIPPAQMEILAGHQKPILLLRKKKQGTRLSPLVAPDNPYVGSMLPYAPLQLLLFSYPDGIEVSDSLVMTSGNVSGAPIARDDKDALEMLSGFCDLILSHDRKIRIRSDDTVMDFFEGEPYMIRRSRGYAPLPVMMSKPYEGSVLGIGGELKNTFCMGKNSLFYPSSYVGDLADLRTVEALEESEERMETLLEMEPQAVACDLHPRYNSTAVAEKIAKERDLPLVKVQHHYAHILSCMAENDREDPVIGVSFDGTGYGTDGTIWGGELLVADRKGFTRAGSIVPFLQCGGDASSKEGWRIAVSMLYGLEKEKAKQEGRPPESARAEVLDMAKALGLADETAVKMQFLMADKKINSVFSTSAGRLFDGVSAILGIRKASTFEGEASTALMYRALEYEEKAGGPENARQSLTGLCCCSPRVRKKECTPSGAGPAGQLNVQEELQAGTAQDDRENGYALENGGDRIGAEDFLLLPTDALVDSLVQQALSFRKDGQAAEGKEADGNASNETAAHGSGTDGQAAVGKTMAGEAAYGEAVGKMAYAFHESLAQMICSSVLEISERTGIRVAALSGGVFQNRLLLRTVQEALEKEGIEVLRHHLIPPNDGGIALGQAVYAMEYLRKL